MKKVCTLEFYDDMTFKFIDHVHNEEVKGEVNPMTTMLTMLLLGVVGSVRKEAASE